MTVTPTITGLAAGTYTADVTVTARRRDRLAQDGRGDVRRSARCRRTWSAPGASTRRPGTTTADASGRGNTGTLSGATRNTGGRFGGALSFDGVNDWVTVAGRRLARPHHRHDARGVGPPDRDRVRLADACCSRSSPATSSTRSTPATARAAPRRTSSPPPTAASAARRATPLNAWTHLAATYDGATLRLYVNGVQAALARAVTGAIRVSTGALRIGGNSIWSDEWFAGLIDEVRVYNRALTAAEIQADMTRPVTGG